MRDGNEIRATFTLCRAGGNLQVHGHDRCALTDLGTVCLAGENLQVYNQDCQNCDR